MSVVTSAQVQAAEVRIMAAIERQAVDITLALAKQNADHSAALAKQRAEICDVMAQQGLSIARQGAKFTEALRLQGWAILSGVTVVVAICTAIVTLV